MTIRNSLILSVWDRLYKDGPTLKELNYFEYFEYLNTYVIGL